MKIAHRTFTGNKSVVHGHTEIYTMQMWVANNEGMAVEQWMVGQVYLIASFTNLPDVCGQLTRQFRALNASFVWHDVQDMLNSDNMVILTHDSTTLTGEPIRYNIVIQKNIVHHAFVITHPEE